MFSEKSLALQGEEARESGGRGKHAHRHIARLRQGARRSNVAAEDDGRPESLAVDRERVPYERYWLGLPPARDDVRVRREARELRLDPRHRRAHAVEQEPLAALE